MIHFITGNKGKLDEARAILGEVDSFDVDLPEVQEVDPHKIIKEKLREAQNHKKGAFIVEDTSLYYDGMNGLPGPLIKWFLETIGNEGLYKLTESFGCGAHAKTIIGYISENGEISYHEGAVAGEIVSPRGDMGFGWDPVFKPEGFDKTFAEMSQEEKNSISMRKMALEELKNNLYSDRDK